MALFGDSITTDHISPAGSIKESSPAGQWLKAHGVLKADFNSYGSRRGNHDVMMRGTFANVRIKNLMIPPGADGSREEGGVTLFQPGGEKMFIYDAAMKYMAAGHADGDLRRRGIRHRLDRDWAAKGTQLLGIKAVVARSFERIHRSNLVGMGVLPLQFKRRRLLAERWASTGDETDRRRCSARELKPQQDATLVIHRRRRHARRRSTRDAAHRHADRGRLLPARRHPAVRAAAAARGLRRRRTRFGSGISPRRARPVAGRVRGPCRRRARCRRGRTLTW